MTTTDLNLLVLDTSTTPCCAALTVSGNEIVQHGFTKLDEPRDLSSLLLRLVDDTLTQAAWTLDEVNLLAVGLGPGSWTGLRIGISAFKTLAQARELPLYGVGTFEGLYQSVSGATQQLTGIVAPSRPGEIYGVIAQGSENETVSLWTPQAFAQALVAQDELASLPLIVGTDPITCEAVAAELRTLGYDPRIEIPDARRMSCGVGAVALARHLSGQHDNALRVEPLYLAPSNAERAREAKLLAAAAANS